MNKNIFYILTIVTFTSCVSDKPWSGQAERFQVSSKASNYFSVPDSKDNYAMDSTLYDRLLDKGSSEFCAMLAAYSLSEVELERELPNRCHKQFFSFSNCSANMDNDTLSIIFETKNPRRSMASNKIIKIDVFERDHRAEIIHWGGEFMEVINIDGSIETRKSPTSSVVDSRLKLNQDFYQMGDTLIGEVKLTSYQIKGRRKTKVREYTEGKFRAIIGGSGLNCDETNLLANSLLLD